MSDSKSILDQIRAKRSKQSPEPVRYEQREIAGQVMQVPVYAETKARPKTHMKTRGKQTNDASLTKHMSIEDIQRVK